MGNWRCDICDKEIRPGDGYVEVVDAPSDAPPGGYPREATPEPEPSGELGLTLQEALERIPRPRIKFRACHTACQIDKRGSYWIGTERADTLEDWISWVMHLGQKQWMGRRDIVRMLGFWWKNRGLPLPDA